MNLLQQFVMEAFTFQWVKITHNLFSLIQFTDDLPYA